MAEMWYYTTEGKQMDPVTIKELKRLVGDGVLKPTDMVWKDGMARWIRASSVKELFPDPTSGLDKFFTHAKDEKGEGHKMVTMPVASTPVPAQAVTPMPQSQPTGAVEVDVPPESPKKPRPADDREDDRPVPRRKPASAGSSTGIIIALILGAMLVLVALAVGVVIIIYASTTTEGKINPNNLIKTGAEVKYDLDLNPNAIDTRLVSLRKGVEYEFIVKPQRNDVDIDLRIFDWNRKMVRWDDRPDADCYLRWVPDQDGEYRVEIKNESNKGQNVQRTNATVTIREFKENAPIAKNDKKEEPKVEPPPPGVLEGKGFKDFTVSLAKKEVMQKFRVQKGYKASFTFVPSNPDPRINFNIIVVKDSDPNIEIAKDERPEAGATVSFTMPNTEIVRVRILNASQKGVTLGMSKGVLNYDVSP